MPPVEIMVGHYLGYVKPAAASAAIGGRHEPEDAIDGVMLLSRLYPKGGEVRVV